jgi:hypothetical protein
MEGQSTKILISSRSVNKHGRHRQFLFLVGRFFLCLFLFVFVCSLVFNVTFNNISDILWRSVLLVEDPEKVTDKPYLKMLYTSRSPWSRFELTTSVVIDIYNYHTITATTALWSISKRLLHDKRPSINPFSSQSSETAYPVQCFHDRYRQFLSVIGQLNKIFSKATWPN